MGEIETSTLTDILLNESIDQMKRFEEQHLSALANMTFGEFYLDAIAQHGISRSVAIANSGVEVHYAYQILSGDRKAKRDKLISLCIGGGLTRKETDRALARAEVGCLYPKRIRDAIMILAINKGVRTVWNVNAMLASYKQPLLE